MKHLASLSPTLALVLLCGCGGGTTSGRVGTPPPLTGNFVNIAGNWHLDTMSKDSGTPTVVIDGAINQSGASLSGVVHVDSSNCSDRLTTVGLTGTVSGNDVSLTSTSPGGELTTLSGSSNGDSFAGTYSIKGGCADGDQGRIIGNRILPISNSFSGTFTPSEGESFYVAGTLAQDSRASSEGSFGLSGNVSFRTSCFSLGTLKSGIFPSGSFIVGTSTALEIETGNGTVTFLGRLNPATGETAGDYTVSGGTCDQTGTALLVVANPWDY